VVDQAEGVEPVTSEAAQAEEAAVTLAAARVEEVAAILAAAPVVAGGTATPSAAKQRVPTGRDLYKSHVFTCCIAFGLQSDLFLPCRSTMYYIRRRSFLQRIGTDGHRLRRQPLQGVRRDSHVIS